MTAPTLSYGCDLSHWNALTDAHALKASGIDFAWVKVTEGTSGVDATWAQKADDLAAAGIIVGAYHYLDGNDAAAEAAHFLSIAAPLLTAGHLFYLLDMEAALARGAANAEVRTFADAVGLPMLTYGNVDWWGNTLDQAQWGTQARGGVVASWNGQPGGPAWQIATTKFHQFNDALLRPGVAGAFDGDCTMPGVNLADYVYGGALPPTPTPTPTPTPLAAPNPWIVQAGDTLSAIAAAWGVTVSAVAVINGIPNPDLIHIDQTIWKPGTQPVNVLPPAPIVTGHTYVVAAGDTVSAIAARAGTTVAEIVYLNHLANPDRIEVGQVLELPAVNPAGGVGTYVVRSGDTLSAIAAHLHYPGGWPALARANNIAGPRYVIHPGDIIHY